MKTKTLSEVLAEMGESPVSADNHQIQVLDETNFYQLTTTKPPKLNRLPKNNTLKKPSQPKSLVTASSHDTAPPPISHTPADKTQPQKTLKNPKPKSLSKSQIGELLKHAQGGQDSIVMPKKLADSLSDVAIEPLIQTDKATNYLRWLAFYYLSRREMSQHELQKKLLAKGCEPQAVEDLLQEFAQKGYQSDERFAMMLVRESIRKGRGKNHILQALKSAKVNLPESVDSIDQLIQQAGADSLTDGTILTCDESETIDWLKLAVEVRTRKYGDTIPTTPKDKAKQLRFLQYRGFEFWVCLEALKLSLADFQEA